MRPVAVKRLDHVPWGIGLFMTFCCKQVAWPFDLELLTFKYCDVINPYTNFEFSTTVWFRCDHTYDDVTLTTDEWWHTAKWVLVYFHSPDGATWAGRLSIDVVEVSGFSLHMQLFWRIYYKVFLHFISTRRMTPLLLSHFSQSVRPSVCLSVCRTRGRRRNGSNRMVQHTYMWFEP